MAHEAMKLELIEWLTRLEDEETIQYLKMVMESETSDKDWWDELPEHVKKGINQSIEDKEKNRLTLHEDVARKYGLGN
ncbi:MAG: hypothetical protein EA411_01445 [Saprospirales bacterium]|nr:MAG: hypothetical protein EA411_01445 [Saprospirales bacterium]